MRKIIHRIAGTGRRVFTNRAAKLQQRDAVPVWRREVSDATVRYVINPEHPLVRELMNDDDPARRARNRACLRLVSASFPSDLYFSDAANDDVEFGPVADEAQMIEVVQRLIEALQNVGLQGEDLRHQLMKIEMPDLPAEVIERLLAYARPA